MFNYQVLFQGIEFSGYLRYIFYGKSFSSLGRAEPARHHDKATSSATGIIHTLNMLLSMLIHHLIFSVLLLISYSLGFLIWVSHFFILTLFTNTQEGARKKRKESDSVSQSIRSGQLLSLIIHRL